MTKWQIKRRAHGAARLFYARMTNSANAQVSPCLTMHAYTCASIILIASVATASSSYQPFNGQQRSPATI